MSVQEFVSHINTLPTWSKSFLKNSVVEIIKNYNNTNNNSYPRKETIFDFMRVETVKLIVLIPSPSYIWKNNIISRAGKNIELCLKHNNLLDNNASIDIKVWNNNGILVFPLSLIDNDSCLWDSISNNLLQFIINNKPVIMFGKYNIESKTSEQLIWSSPNISTKTGKDKFMLCPHFIYVHKKFNVSFDETLGETLVETIAETLVETLVETIGETLAETLVENYENDIYTDAGCIGNGTNRAIAGSAVVFKSSELNEKTTVHYFKIPHSIIGNKVIYPTSQRGEGFAILYALNFLNDFKNEKKHHINIITDSEFWIKMITLYMPKWYKETGDYTKFITHANYDITNKMYTLMQTLNQRYKIIFKHIKSHNKDKQASNSDILGNEMADKYATLAIKLKNYDIVII